LHRSDLTLAVVCGPTAAGKTRFAISLANHLGGEIVGADSMQIFRHMDIGTAKPTPNEQAAARHHLIDVVLPDCPFDAARYVRLADEAIQDIVARGKVPLIVGGTGLYIKALTLGLFHTPPIDSETRKKLKEKIEAQGNQSLHQYLSKVDPEAAVRINVNDTQRLIRAIEVFELTGEKISSAQKKHGFETPRYRTIKIGLQLERKKLYERIDQRVDVMIAEGLLEEVQGLLKKGFDPNLKSMQSLGYRHMIRFIQGELSWDEALRTLKRDHRRYAKRQMTWFGADREIHGLDPTDTSKGLELIGGHLA